MKTEIGIEYRLTDSLTPYARNARTHSKAQIEQIAGSISAFGFINPIIIDETGMIVAGHARVLAAKELGLVQVPVIPIDHLSKDEKRAYILADNKLAESAGWDEGLLRIELEHLARVDVSVDVDLTGFSVPEIDMLLSPTESELVPEEPPPALPSTDAVISRVGDLWLLGSNRILCGDCRDPARGPM